MIFSSKEYSGACPCGREHSTVTDLLVIERGCLHRLNDYLDQFGMQGVRVAIYDENTYAATADRHPAVDFEVILDPHDLHANEHGVALLQSKLPEKADVLIAIGSGTVHDITRYCAYVNGCEFVSCPTAASVDGYCSSVAAMTWKGCKKTLTAVAPRFVLADTDIFPKAPLYLAKSGFGDMIGKYVALAEWRLSHVLTGEHHCQRIADLTADATQAVLDSARGIVRGEESAFEHLMYGLLLSGLAMQMMGNSRPASGAEHHISHMIEMAPDAMNAPSDALHGEKVGVGTLLALREYRRIALLPHIEWKDYPGMDRDSLYPMFGDRLTDELVMENEKDCAAGVTGARLAECFEKIRAILMELPDPDEMTALYEELDIKSTLEDIGVPSKHLQDILHYSPCVRNRLTLMRLRRCMV